jgi:hypothetical protein
MNLDPEREELLNDLLTDSSSPGPSLDAVLELARAERRRRGQLRLAAGVAGMLALMGALFVSLSQPHAVAPATQAALSVPPAKTFMIKKVNDEELLALLADQPVALVKLPSGERRLLMVVHDDGGE